MGDWSCVAGFGGEVDGWLEVIYEGLRVDRMGLGLGGIEITSFGEILQ